MVKLSEKHNQAGCTQAKLAIQDTLDIVGGKWKLVLITILISGKRRFKELTREAGISPRILSKELYEMQMNGLVTRTVKDTRPVTVEYELTPYATTLRNVLEPMEAWGRNHRKKIMVKES